MADVGENLRSFLLSSTAILEIVGQRVHQDAVPETSEEAFIWYSQRSSESPFACLDDEAGVEPDVVSFDVECVSDDIAEAKRLAAAVRALCPHRGTFGAGAAQLVTVEDQNDDYVPRSDMSDEGRNVCALSIDVYPRY